jgi:hypothetical protein
LLVFSHSSLLQAGGVLYETSSRQGLISVQVAAAQQHTAWQHLRQERIGLRAAGICAAVVIRCVRLLEGVCSSQRPPVHLF